MFSFILLSPLPLLLSFSLFLFPSLLPRFSHLRLTSPLASPPFILIFISLNRLRRRFTNLETFVPLLRFPLFINLSGGDRGFSLFPSLSSVAPCLDRYSPRVQKVERQSPLIRISLRQLREKIFFHVPPFAVLRISGERKKGKNRPRTSGTLLCPLCTAFLSFSPRLETKKFSFSRSPDTPSIYSSDRLLLAPSDERTFVTRAARSLRFDLSGDPTWPRVAERRKQMVQVVVHGQEEDERDKGTAGAQLLPRGEYPSWFWSRATERGQPTRR